jgi:tetratricopeptide (TPR) repeat protein
MIKRRIKLVGLATLVLGLSLSVVGCNQYVAGAKVRLQEDPPNYDAAITTLNEGLEYAPKDSEMHSLLAYCYVQTRQFKKAGESYANAVEFSPDKKDSLQKMWDDTWEDLHGMSGAQIKKFATGPKDSSAFYLNKAMEHIDQAIDLSPKKVENFIRKGLIYRYQGKQKESEEMYAKALAIDPYNPDAYYQVGRSAMESSNWDEAIKNLTKATQLKKDNESWFYWLGVAQLQKRDFPGAQKSFKTATGIKPDDKNAWFNLGQAYYFEGTDVPSAIAAMEKVISLDDADVEAYSLLGLSALHNTVNNFDKAIEAYSRALLINPSSQEYKNYLEYAKKQKEAASKPAPKKKR